MWLRVKKPDMEVVVLNTDPVVAWEVAINLSEETGGEYALIVSLKDGCILALLDGTFSECHMLLNKIHKSMKLDIIDI